MDVNGGADRIRRVDKKLCKVEERMMEIELGVERSSLIREGLVLDSGSALNSVDAPGGLVEFAESERLTVRRDGPDPIDVLRKIANLIKRVPYGHLYIAFGRTGWQSKFNLNKMLRGVRQRNCVVNLGCGRRRFRGIDLWYQEGSKPDEDKLPATNGRDQAFAGSFMGIELVDAATDELATISLRRCGSFS